MTSPAAPPVPGSDTWEASRDGWRNRAGGGSRGWFFEVAALLVLDLAVRRDIVRYDWLHLDMVKD